MTIFGSSAALKRRKAKHRSGEPVMPPLNPTAMSLVKALINLAHELQLTANQYIVHSSSNPCLLRRNITTITRRVKILLMLFEEIKEAGLLLLPPSALMCFSKLHVVIQEIKLLIDDCMESSRVWILMEHHRLSEQFLVLTQDMANALEMLPLSLLDVSCEVREQVELVQAQARKAKLYIERNEAELWSEVQSVMVALERKEMPEAGKLAKIFQSLKLETAMDCQKEVQRMMQQLQEGDEDAGAEEEKRRMSCLNDLVSFVRYCKCVLYGATDMEASPVMDAMEEGDEGEEAGEDEMRVPDDLRCPISLELMVDPVIVATGQTYEREAITRWMEGGHDKCPKSGLKLTHTTLIPNYALRSVIRQWCVRHNVRLPAVAKTCARRNSSHLISSSPPTAVAMEATKLTAEFLVRELTAVSSTPDVQRRIVGELRLLAKSGSDNRKLVAEAGAIHALIPFLSSADPRLQEHAVTAILNLSIYMPNKALIVDAGALNPLIALLHRRNFAHASEAARENSAAALFSLSHVTDYAAVLGRCHDAIDGLIELLQQGSMRGKHDAFSALFNIAVHHPNRPALVRAGVVVALMDLLPTQHQHLVEEALAVLAILAGCAEGRAAIISVDSTSLTLLINLLRTATPKGKESTASILLHLARYGGDTVINKLLHTSPPLMPCLYSLLSTGTPRTARKAMSLLRILQRWDAMAATASSSSQPTAALNSGFN